MWLLTSSLIKPFQTVTLDLFCTFYICLKFKCSFIFRDNKSYNFECFVKLYDKNLKWNVIEMIYMVNHNSRFWNKKKSWTIFYHFASWTNELYININKLLFYHIHLLVYEKEAKKTQTRWERNLIWQCWRVIAVIFIIHRRKSEETTVYDIDRYRCECGIEEKEIKEREITWNVSNNRVIYNLFLWLRER